MCPVAFSGMRKISRMCCSTSSCVKKVPEKLARLHRDQEVIIYAFCQVSLKIFWVKLSFLGFPSKFCSLYSEQVVPTPILKSVPSQFSFCLGNYKCVACFTKQLLPKIAPKGRTKEKITSAKTQSFNLCRVQ